MLPLFENEYKEGGVRQSASPVINVRYIPPTNSAVKGESAGEQKGKGKYK
jgi:hypothetical protein